MIIPVGGVGRNEVDGGLFYDYVLRITFGELNPEGTVDHHMYAALFGKARELFVLEGFPDFPEQAGRDYLIHTSNAHYDFLKNFYLGDLMVVRVRVSKVKKQAFQIKADFIHVATDEIRAKGSQLIACTSLEGKLIDIPDGLKKALLNTLPEKSRSATPV